MPYQPGPLLLQSAGNVGIATSDYNFAGDVDDQLHELGTIPGGWESFLSDATLLMGESSDPFPDVDIGAAMLTVHAYSDPSTLLGIGPMVQALAVADVQMGQAIGFAPAEAWTDSGAPFVAPGPSEIIGVPVIPPNSINVTVSGIPLSGTTGTPVHPQVTSSTVSLLNTSQYGSSNFRVGDQFQVTAIGPINAEVKVHATHNGADLGVATIGTIATDQKLIVPGVWDSDSAGVWHEDWFVNGLLVSSFDFVVVGGGGNTATSPPAITTSPPVVSQIPGGGGLTQPAVGAPALPPVVVHPGGGGLTLPAVGAPALPPVVLHR